MGVYLISGVNRSDYDVVTSTSDSVSVVRDTRKGLNIVFVLVSFHQQDGFTIMRVLLLLVRFGRKSTCVTVKGDMFEIFILKLNNINSSPYRKYQFPQNYKHTLLMSAKQHGT